jgi:hypothetical protein
VNRGLDESAQVCRDILGILPNTLDVTVNGGVALEMRLDGIDLILNKET